MYSYDIGIYAKFSDGRIEKFNSVQQYTKNRPYTPPVEFYADNSIYNNPITALMLFIELKASSRSKSNIKKLYEYVDKYVITGDCAQQVMKHVLTGEEWYHDGAGGYALVVNGVDSIVTRDELLAANPEYFL